jgi:hypothetical protein
MRNEANHRGKQIVSNKASANFFVVTGFYYTSEREPHATVDRRILSWVVLLQSGYSGKNYNRGFFFVIVSSFSCLSFNVCIRVAASLSKSAHIFTSSASLCMVGNQRRSEQNRNSAVFAGQEHILISLSLTSFLQHYLW